MATRAQEKQNFWLTELMQPLKSQTAMLSVSKKRLNLTYDVNYRARLVAADSFSVSGFDSLYGFLSGLCAGDHDITDVFVDATFRIGGRDYEAFADFLKKVDELSKITDTAFTFTVSTDLENLPERIFEYCEKVN